MNKMAEELLNAKKKYESIDLELKKEELCCKLERELAFFKRDNTELRRQTSLMKSEIIILK
jgi:hypothetical protein